MRAGDPSADRQAHAQAAFLGGEEGLEYALQAIGRNARSEIPDTDLHGVVHSNRSDNDRRLRVGVL